MRLISILFLTGLSLTSFRDTQAQFTSRGAISDSSEILEPNILQVKYGRLYLSLGEESLVLPGCRLYLVCGSDTLLRGTIEQSFEGVSISTPLEGVENLSLGDNCLTRIIPARIDTVKPVVVATDIPPSSPLQHLLIPNDGRASVHNPVYYESRTAMLIDYERGIVDGYLSYRSDHSGTTENRVLTRLAPYTAVLSPHPARSINQDGALTTSLYYRFNPASLSDLFEGSDPRLTTRLFKHESRLRDRPRLLRVFVQDRSLESVASFFVDILSRDRCRVKLVRDRNLADILFVWYLPPFFGAHPMQAFRLAEDTTAKARINESIRLLDNLLSAAFADTSESRRAYLLDKADRVLWYDLGYFPLFTPALYFTVKRNIVGDPFIESGEITFSRLGRIVLPDSEAELR